MKREPEFAIELRKIWGCGAGKHAIPYVERMRIPDPGDVTWRVGRLSDEFGWMNLKSTVTDCAPDDAKIWIKGPAKEANKVVSVIRRQFASDSWDHQRYVNLEIEVIGPGEGERKIYGTKGPPKWESAPVAEAPKATISYADGEAPEIYPFEITNLLGEKEDPEVRVEFSDWPLLGETLELEEDPDFDGSPLGDQMMLEIAAKKLVKDTEGTHPGGCFDNHDADNLLFHFNSMNDAIRVAEYFAPIFTDKRKLRALFKKSGIQLDV